MIQKRNSENLFLGIEFEKGLKNTLKFLTKLETAQVNYIQFLLRIRQFSGEFTNTFKNLLKNIRKSKTFKKFLSVFARKKNRFRVQRANNYMSLNHPSKAFSSGFENLHNLLKTFNQMKVLNYST